MCLRLYFRTGKGIRVRAGGAVNLEFPTILVGGDLHYYVDNRCNTLLVR